MCSYKRKERVRTEVWFSKKLYFRGINDKWSFRNWVYISQGKARDLQCRVFNLLGLWTLYFTVWSLRLSEILIDKLNLLDLLICFWKDESGFKREWVE